MSTESVPIAPLSPPIAAEEKRDTSLVLVLGVALVLWSSAFVGIRYAVRFYPPGSIALFRFLVASVLLSVYFYGTRGSRPSPRLSARDWAGFFVLGATGIFAYHLALNTGERTVSAGAASLLVNTTPLFTVVLAVVFLGERLSGRALVGIAVAFAGAAMVSVGAGGGLAWGALDRGVVYVLVAAVVQAIYFAVQKPMLQKFGALELTLRSSLFGCFLLLVFGPQLATTIRQAPLSATLVVLFLGVGPSAIAYLSWAHLVSRISVSEAVGYLYLVPVLALAMGFFLLAETPGFLSIAGGAATLAGVSLIRRPVSGRRG
jgi:drug/metabolite transporter (DMT)-like permease